MDQKPPTKRAYNRTGWPKGWRKAAQEAGIPPGTYYSRRKVKMLTHEEALSRPKYLRLAGPPR